MNKKQKIRSEFREKVFARDKHKCRTCKGTLPIQGELDAHHITDRNDIVNGGYVKENGISLCPLCHLRAERYHVSGGKDFVPGYHPDELYKLIGSSKELAIEKSNLI